MSVILQPYQILPFNTSLDFQTSRKKGGSLCDFENLIDEGSFVPFAILSPDETIGSIELYGCNDEWIQSLSLVITSEQDPETGLWFHYYNGDDLGLSCGTYYISILVGDFIWYSEHFTIRDIVNISQYPELIKDDYHLALRIYDSITKQLANKTDIGCDLQPLNPVSTIMPFMFDTDEDINSLNVFLVDACSLNETDLSADLELEFIKSNPGAIVEQEILTTSQQLRNEFYEFDKRNFIFQEFKINDTGDLKNFLFEWYFGNETQTITVDLILGTNPSTVPIITKTITDNATTSKELTIDYSLDAIPVTAGEIYIMKFSTDADCSAAIGVNAVKVYPDGRFAERNNILQFKDQILLTLTGDYTNGNIKYATFGGFISNECFGDSLYPSNPATFSYKYTASEDQVIQINTSGFSYDVVAVPLNLAIGTFKIKHNAIDLFSDVKFYFSNASYSIPNQVLYVKLVAGDIISIEFNIQSAASVGSQNIDLGAQININVYNYGTVILGTYIPTGFIPLGISYKNKSLWFYCNITKDVYVGGFGDTIIYNPGRPLPSPLICGNYYLKLVSSLHTWYSEWFRIINVGSIDLTTFVLGTEDGEIIITEDSEIITLE